MNLSEKESAVLQEVHKGVTDATSIATNIELAVQSVHGVINSLVNKELLVKQEDKTLRLGAKFVEYTISLAANNSDQGDGDQRSEDKPPVIKPSAGSGSVDNDLEKTESKGIAVVIPYLRSEAASDELRYALRSWADHFEEKHHIIVVGDREDWFSPEITHIPMDPVLILEDCNCAAPAEIRNPQADVTNKILALIAAGEIEGDFILSNDDIFLAGHTTLADIQSHKAFGDLEDHGKGTSIYCGNALRTKRALQENGSPTAHFGTHTPLYLNAELLAEVIEKYEATEKGYLLGSLYFNDVFPYVRPIQVDGKITDPILASVYRNNVEPELMHKIFADRKFVNCDTKGWVSVEPVVKSIFANPSRYEQ